MAGTVIATNILAMNSRRNLKAIGGIGATASERLSTGSRINSAADDAAGLAISEKLKAQIKGMKQAQKNTEDAVNMCKTMDGGMDGIQEMMIRQRELIIQSINDTNTDEDRAKIQAEIDQLTDEIAAVADRTTFNNIPLLKGKSGSVQLVNVEKEIQAFEKIGDREEPLYVYTSYVSNASLTSYASILKNATFTDNDTKSNQTYYFSESSGGYNSTQFNIERYILEEDGTDITGDIKTLLGVTSEWDGKSVEVAISDYKGANDYKITVTVDGKVTELVVPPNSSQTLADAIKEGIIGLAGYSPVGDGDVTQDVKAALGITNEWDGQNVEVKVSDYAGSGDYKITITVNGETAELVLPPNPDQSMADAIKAGIKLKGYVPSSSNGYRYKSFQDFLKYDLFNADGTIDPDKADYFAERVASAMERGFKAKGYNFTVSGTIEADGSVAFNVTAPPNSGLYMGGCTAIPSGGFGHYFMHEQFSPGGTPIESGQTVHFEDWGWVTKTVTEMEEVTVFVKPLDPLWIQSGANSGQGMFLDRYDCTPESLYRDVFDPNTITVNVDGTPKEIALAKLVTQPYEEAIASIIALDSAFGKVNEYRAREGAQQNRLEFIDSYLAVAFTNLEDANSRIADADMAKEMMNFTKANVLKESAVAMLAQANQSPQSVLQLLK